MLVLSRMRGESIRIGNDITITIDRISGSKVRLALTAPKDVLILRSELDQLDKGDSDGGDTNDE